MKLQGVLDLRLTPVNTSPEDKSDIKRISKAE